MKNQLLITIVTADNLKSKSILGKILKELESSELFMPDQWGPNEIDIEPYDGKKICQYILDEEEYCSVFLMRRTRPNYDGFFAEYPLHLSVLEIETFAKLSKANNKAYFDLGSRLAENMKADFGFVHFVTESTSKTKPSRKLKKSRVENYKLSGNIDPKNFQKFGLRNIHARTWLGPHILKLFAPNRIKNLKCPHRETVWGGIELDLLEDPWTAEFHDLVEHQEEIFNELSKDGIFGDFSDFPDYQPAPSWKPIPLRK